MNRPRSTTWGASAAGSSSRRFRELPGVLRHPQINVLLRGSPRKSAQLTTSFMQIAKGTVRERVRTCIQRHAGHPLAHVSLGEVKVDPGTDESSSGSRTTGSCNKLES